MRYREQDDDEEDDDIESPDDDGISDESDSVDTDPCPHCGKPVYEQAEMCPHCGRYISMEDSSSRKPLWIILTALACLAAIVFFWIR